MAFHDLSSAAARRIRIRAQLPTEHPGVLDEISALLDGLPDPEYLDAEQRAGSMAVAAALRNRLEAWLTGLAGVAEVHGDSRVLHAGTTGMLVAAATGANPAAGSATVARAKALQNLPGVAAGFAAGQFSAAHVAVITGAAAHLPRLPELDRQVAAIAAGTEPGELARLLNVLIGQDNPPHPDADLARQRDRRGLSLSEHADGRFRITGWLDQLEGTRLRAALRVFTDRPGAADQRSPQARRADALADLAAAALANTRPLGVSGLSVLVDAEHLPGGLGAVLEDGYLLGPGGFDLATCTTIATLILGVTRNGTFLPLQLHRGARRASAGQWAALIARDRGCIRCGRAPRFCQAHHIVAWRHGGMTDLSNLTLLCSRCHTDLHLGRYTITIDPHGIPHINPTPRAPP